MAFLDFQNIDKELRNDSQTSVWAVNSGIQVAWFSPSLGRAVTTNGRSDPVYSHDESEQLGTTGEIGSIVS